MNLGKLGIPILDPGEFEGSYRSRIWRLYLQMGQMLPESQIVKDLLASSHSAARHLETMIHQGGSATRYQEFHFVTWFLWRANAAGVEKAKVELEEYFASDVAPVIHTYWLFNIDVETPLDLGGGMSIVPAASLPDSQEKHAAMSIEIESFSVRQNRPACALTCVRDESKFVADHDFLGAISRQFWQTAMLINLLAGKACCGGFQTTYRPESVPPGMFGGAGGSYTLPDILFSGTSKLSVEDVKPLKNLLNATSAWKNEVELQAVLSAVYRLSQAKARQDIHGAMLDLGIALEMVLLNDTHTPDALPGQLSEKFRLRGSWLIADNLDERKDAYDLLRKIYTGRSQVAHMGRSELVEKGLGSDLHDRMFAIAERVFRKVLGIGAIPNWGHLVLGGRP